MCCGQYKKVTKTLLPASDTTLIQYTGISQFTIRGAISGVLYVFDSGNKKQQYVKTNDVDFLTGVKSGIKNLFIVVPQPLKIEPQAVLSDLNDASATTVAIEVEKPVETVVETKRRKKKSTESVV